MRIDPKSRQLKIKRIADLCTLTQPDAGWHIDAQIVKQWAIKDSTSRGNLAGNQQGEQGGNAEDDALSADDVAQLLAQMPPEVLRAVLQRAGELKAKEGAEWGRALKEQHE